MDGSDPDTELVLRVVAGDDDAFTDLMRRYNRRLFRVVRGVVRADADAEDVCQEAWLRAYVNLATLRDGTAFSPWLARIGMRCAVARIRQDRGLVDIDDLDRVDDRASEAPAELRLDQEALARGLEAAIDTLPASYRVVVLLRDIEHMTTAEVARVLDTTEENVRVRLHRARTTLREHLARAHGPELEDVFRFDGDRCVRITGAVMRTIETGSHSDATYATRSALFSSVSSRPSTVS